MSSPKDDVNESESGAAEDAKSSGNGAGSSDDGHSGEQFDAVAAAEELVASLGVEPHVELESHSAGTQGAGAERYIAMLEEEVRELGALVQKKDRAVTAAEERADRAQEEISRAGERLAKSAKEDLRRRTEKLLIAFISVLDDLDRALASARATDHNPAVVEGVDLVRHRFLTTLQGFGVTHQPSRGALFDPNLHDALGTNKCDPEQDGHVLEVIEEGYLLDGVVLRPARVIVGKNG